jgi:hypothetical protein
MEGKGKSSKLSMAWRGIAVLLLSLAIAFTALVLTPVMAQEGAVTITVNAPEYVDEGATFAATIDVDSVTDLNSAQFDLSFDSSVVRVSDVKDGKINGEDIPIAMWVLNPAKDTMRVIANLEEGGSVSGPGYLAEVELKVKGDEGEKTELSLLNGRLYNISVGKISAEWRDAEIRIAEEKKDEDVDEEVGEEVTLNSPVITAWKPAEAVVSNAVGESMTFNITVNQIADISWQINCTEVQTNNSVTEAVYTNTSVVIGTWNVSAIATNTTTGLSDMHTWLWSVIPTTTVTPTPIQTPRVTPAPEAEIETETKVTPTPTQVPKVTPTPTTPTPTPKTPGFEVVLAIAVLSTIAHILLRKR